MKERKIKRIVKGYATTDGAGVKLIRVLGREDAKDIDPFLMMDAFGSDNPEDYIKGFPMHPHRGIETITYLLEGQIDHRDSIGNSGSLKGGELQWMTSGSGIMHEEMPQATDRLIGLQFWLNLPRQDKMTAPAYFPITPEMIEVIEIEGGEVKLIAGEYADRLGIQSKFAEVTMLDVRLEPGANTTLLIDDIYNGFLYLFDGSASFGADRQTIKLHSAAILDQGDTLSVIAGDGGVQFVLLAGKPLNEPIAWGGPVVMNTQEEVQRAFEDLRDGNFVKK